MADEEDPVDVKPTMEANAKPLCQKYVAKYEACAERVREKGSGDCQGQYWDMYHCIDSIVAPKLFPTLK